MGSVLWRIRYGLLWLQQAEFNVFNLSNVVLHDGYSPIDLKRPFEKLIRNHFRSPHLRPTKRLDLTVLYNQYIHSYTFVIGLTPQEYSEWLPYLTPLMQSEIPLIDLRGLERDNNTFLQTFSALTPHQRRKLAQIGEYAQENWSFPLLARLAYSVGVPADYQVEERLIGIALALQTLMTAERWKRLNEDVLLQGIHNDPVLAAAWKRLNDMNINFDDPEALARACIEAGFPYAPCCNGLNPECETDRAMQRLRSLA